MTMIFRLSFVTCLYGMIDMICMICSICLICLRRMIRVIANPDAFAKNNPNFLFSDKRLYLPGKADITKLMIGTKVTKNHGGEDDDSRTKSIYFFGG